MLSVVFFLPPIARIGANYLFTQILQIEQIFLNHFNPVLCGKRAAQSAPVTIGSGKKIRANSCNSWQPSF
jgi:hypothetical protein